jgi:hypothetical protein
MCPDPGPRTGRGRNHNSWSWVTLCVHCNPPGVTQASLTLPDTWAATRTPPPPHSKGWFVRGRIVQGTHHPNVRTETHRSSLFPCCFWSFSSMKAFWKKKNSLIVCTKITPKKVSFYSFCYVSNCRCRFFLHEKIQQLFFPPVFLMQAQREC